MLDLRRVALGNFAWGFVAQISSSAVNFGLTVVAARLLGSEGLGTVYIGFAAYQLVLGLQRAMVTQPLVANASPLGEIERRRLADSGLTVIFGTGLGASIVFGVAGFAAGGNLGRGLLLFAPWLAGSLLQEFWKAALFQEGRGGVAALSDAARLGVLAIAIPIMIVTRSDFVVVGSWGLAALVGLVVGLAGLHPSVARPREALAWLRADAWTLGRWLGAREIVYQVSTYATVLALAVLLGASDLGGLRAAEALFSPFSLIAAAFLLPALPALSRAVAVSRRSAKGLTVQISTAAVVLGLGYFVLMILCGSWLLTHLFGRSFAGFHSLIWPFAASQLFYASSFAFTVLLTAEKRGSELLIVGIVGSATTLGFAGGLASIEGVIGAAWGLAAASAAASMLVVAFGLRSAKPPRSLQRVP